MNLPEIEKKILKFWEKNKIFEKSISQRKGKPFFSFYDGPPFATGEPHYGHILATTIKDAVLRYWAMRGFQVPRRVGWDCHGLPVENLIEKELGIKNKREIEKFGIEKFNIACKNSVFRYVKEWVATLKRVGRWANYKAAYATMDKEYTESVWWVFKKLYDLGLIYRDFRVTPYCPRCGTPLSNFEVNQPGAYRDIEDQSVYLKFPIKGKANNFFLVWTTTPWTLPGNTALAVGTDIKYAKVKVGEERYILAKERLIILNEKYEIEAEILGKDLLGFEYEPIFPMALDRPGYRSVSASFVSIEEGTGLVHIAPAFGEEDMELGKQENLPTVVTVDEEGRIKTGLGIPGEGKFVKIADEDIKINLKKRKLLYKEEKIVHSYPFCWRCDTPLLYYPINSWYVAVTKFKTELVKNNQQIHWVPEHLRDGRFGKWLEGARDWAVSRNRFWGAPIPIWQCQMGKNQKPSLAIAGRGGKRGQSPLRSSCGEIKVIGSIEELERLSGKKPKDLHRPCIDEVTFKCERCGGEMIRTPEVFDCWFESGSMPYAQWHYPFENKLLVEKAFPADFIAEGVDQTRGWFYTLHVLATALTLRDLGLGVAKPAYKNVIVNGLILAEDGKKLSKRLRNYTPPEIIFEKFGADTLRYFLLTSTQIGEDYYISDRRIEEVWRRTISTLWHAFLFFQTYTDKNFKPAKNFKPKNLLDCWIMSRLNHLVAQTTKAMDNYELTDGARGIDGFVDDLSNWYIRRSRRRFQKPESGKEKDEAARTLYYVLFNLTKLIAPFIPFISEYIYQNLTKNYKLKTVPRTETKFLARGKNHESVHLCDYPKPEQKLLNIKLEEKMRKIREITAMVLAERAKAGIKVRQPLPKLKIKNRASIYGSEGEEEDEVLFAYQGLKIEKELLNLIKEEANIKEITFDTKIKKEIELDTKITPKLKEEGLAREVIRNIQEMRKKAGLKPKDKISILYSGGAGLNKIIVENKKFIIEETLAQNISLLKSPKVERKFHSLSYLHSLRELGKELETEKEIEIDGIKLWLAIRKT